MHGTIRGFEGKSEGFVHWIMSSLPHTIHQALAMHMFASEPTDDLRLTKLIELLKREMAHAHKRFGQMKWTSKKDGKDDWRDAEFLIRCIWGNAAWLRGLAEHLADGVQVCRSICVLVIFLMTLRRAVYLANHRYTVEPFPPYSS